MMKTAVDDKESASQDTGLQSAVDEAGNMKQKLIQEDDAGTPPSTYKVFLSVGFYMLTSIFMVMANKAFLDKIETPILFLALQMAVAVGILLFCNLLGIYTLPSIDYDTCKKLAPLITVNVVGLTFNTLCLKFVDASFFQVARGLVLPLTVALTWLVMKEQTSQKIIGACGILILSILLCLYLQGFVCLGYFVGVLSEDAVYRLSFDSGLLFGLLSSFTTALHAIVIKRSIQHTRGGILDLVYRNNLLSLLLCIPVVILCGEVGPAYKMFTGQLVDTKISSSASNTLHSFWIGVLVTGGVGFLINLAGFLQIKVTSPTTHMISSAVRGVYVSCFLSLHRLQTFVAVLVFGDIITMGRGLGIVIILFGSSVYTFLKAQGKK